jgi:hypothetical protein
MDVEHINTTKENETYKKTKTEQSGHNSILITKDICRLCNVVYRDMSHKNRHENTIKHLNKLNTLRETHKNSTFNYIKTNKVFNFKCVFCNKQYKYASGLSKHKNKYHCDELNSDILVNNTTNNSINNTTNNELDIEKEHLTNNNTNAEIMNIMKDILKTQLDILSHQQKYTNTLTDKSDLHNNVFNNQGVYINNNVVNINVYLNEYCNNAISLIDFIKNLNVTLDDLKETQTLGYVDGVSHILVKNLVSLKPTERPIHCDKSDKQNLEFYVKEESKWMKDIGNKKIDWSIENITKKQIETLKIWESVHPNWMNSDIETETYVEMVKLCMGGSTQNEIEKNKNEIKKAIARGAKIEDIIKCVK